MSAVPAIGSRIIVGPENGVVKSDLLLVHLAQLVLVLVPFFCPALRIGVVAEVNVGAPASVAEPLAFLRLEPTCT